MRFFNILCSLLIMAAVMAACATTNTTTRTCCVNKLTAAQFTWDFSFSIMHGHNNEPVQVILHLIGRQGEKCLHPILIYDEDGDGSYTAFVDSHPTTASSGRIHFHTITVAEERVVIEGRTLQCFFTVEVAKGPDGIYRKISSPQPRPGFEEKCGPLLTVE